MADHPQADVVPVVEELTADTTELRAPRPGMSRSVSHKIPDYLHDDSTARIFDAATGTERCRLIHDGPVGSVEFNPSGQWVAVGSDDGTARIHLVITADLIAQASARMPRQLTDEEWRRYGGRRSSTEPHVQQI